MIDFSMRTISAVVYCGALKQFGEDVSEQLEYVPVSFKVIRHVRPKFACAACERVVEAPAPSRLIERRLAGPALLAHVLVSKFCDYVGLPVMLWLGGRVAWILIMILRTT